VFICSGKLFAFGAGLFLNAPEFHRNQCVQNDIISDQLCEHPSEVHHHRHTARPLHSLAKSRTREIQRHLPWLLVFFHPSQDAD